MSVSFSVSPEDWRSLATVEDDGLSALKIQSSGPGMVQAQEWSQKKYSSSFAEMYSMVGLITLNKDEQAGTSFRTQNNVDEQVRGR